MVLLRVVWYWLFVQELDIPVKFIGFGEKIDDIGEFNSEDFMRGLLEGIL